MEIATMSEAMQLHAQILKSGRQPDCPNLSKVFTFSALSPSGNLTYARQILQSLPSHYNSYYYNTLIRAYTHSPDPTRSLELFLSMQVQPDKYTYTFLLKSCARLGYAHLGKQLHGSIIRSGLASDLYIQNSLIHMYSSGGHSGLAYNVFEKMVDRDVVSWTSMIDGFVDDDKALEALRLFDQMVDDGVEPNDATIMAVLRACADVGAIGIGMRVHKIINEKGFGTKVNVSTALIDMYGKCGCIEEAMQVFDSVEEKNVFVWTAMGSSLANHGLCKEAIVMFEHMEKHNVKPDEKMMTAVLSAYRNAGFVNEGCAFFENMRKKYGVGPTIQHYGCIVDLFARTGRLSEAEEFIRMMPITPDEALWRTVIWACKVHGDIERAERLIEGMKLQKAEYNDSGSYVLLENLYASSGKWCDKARVRKVMSTKGLKKPAGSSKIEIDGTIHEFTAGDSSHVEAEKVFEKLDEIEERLRNEGYQPKFSEVLLDIEDEDKAFQLLHHSEKLAVALGLIKTNPGTEIRIVKNLRSCEDCHAVMKLISKIYQRTIIVRDRIRFHYFKEGKCSCGDFW